MPRRSGADRIATHGRPGAGVHERARTDPTGGLAPTSEEHPVTRSPARPDSVVEFLRQLDRADAAALTVLRADLCRWLTSVPVSAAMRADVLLAVYETAANAAEHAYPTSGPLRLHSTYDHDRRRLTVLVRDHGRWRIPTDTPDSSRGNGLVLVGAVSTDSAVHVDATGTTVTMQWDLRTVPTHT